LPKNTPRITHTTPMPILYILIPLNADILLKLISQLKYNPEHECWNSRSN
jgi:hypothetical protein